MITTPQENRLANFLYGKRYDSEEAYAEELAKLSPDNYYIGLSSTKIGKAGAVTAELSGYGYARKKVANSGATFSEVSSGSVYNLNSVEWEPAEATWTVRSVFITYGEDVEEASYVFDFDADVTVPATATLYFDPKQLNLSVSDK